MAAVLWLIGTEAVTPNPSTIPGHTALPRTTTYQEVVVDSYTNVRERYHCAPVLLNGTTLDSNEYEAQIDRKLSTAISVGRMRSRAVLIAITEDVPTLSCAQCVSMPFNWFIFFVHYHHQALARFGSCFISSLEGCYIYVYLEVSSTCMSVCIVTETTRQNVLCIALCL